MFFLRVYMCVTVFRDSKLRCLQSARLLFTNQLRLLRAVYSLMSVKACEGPALDVRQTRLSCGAVVQLPHTGNPPHTSTEY